MPRLHRLITAASPLIAEIVASGLDRPEAHAALASVRAWVCLRDLIGAAMAPEVLLRHVASMRRDETLFTLCRIAADLANAPKGLFDPEARSWTHDLLVQRRGSSDPLEAAVADAVAKLPPETAIAHAFVVFFLQVLVAARGSTTGTIPSDGFLAFLMLAANDHIPEWPIVDTTPLSTTERSLAPIFFTSVFNRSDDVMRSLLRLVDILGRYPSRDFPDRTVWDSVQREAFGTSFQDYAEMFLTPMYLLARRWGGKDTPVMFPEAWTAGGGDDAELYARWLEEASIPIEAAFTEFGERPVPSGLLALPKAFFRKPFVKADGKLIGLSPWHVRDHLFLGTWSKLNEACKRVLNTQSNQVFASAFGYCFEAWCGDVAREAASHIAFRDRLILPSKLGAADEIEDVVLLNGSAVALMSAKASLVPEPSLKTANSYADVIRWLRKFFFEEPTRARDRGYRGGALYLLDKKIRRLRAGEYEKSGIKRNATILPVVLCFDHVADTGVMYKWIEEECRLRNLIFVDKDVRPVTIITPEDYEGLMALGSHGASVCELLLEKTERHRKWGPLDIFLHSKVTDSIQLRLPSMGARFQALIDRALVRMREVDQRLKRHFDVHAPTAETAEPSGRT